MRIALNHFTYTHSDTFHRRYSFDPLCSFYSLAAFGYPVLLSVYPFPCLGTQSQDLPARNRLVPAARILRRTYLVDIPDHISKLVHIPPIRTNTRLPAKRSCLHSFTDCSLVRNCAFRYLLPPLSPVSLHPRPTTCLRQSSIPTPQQKTATTHSSIPT